MRFRKRCVKSLSLWRGAVVIGLLVACGSSPVMGPAADVEKIVFVRDGQIFSSTARGSRLLPLVDLGDYLSPSWALDGSEVLFLRRVSSEVETTVYLSVVDSEGKTQRDLFEAAFSTRLIRSPDGIKLMYLTIVGGDPSTMQVQVYNTQTGGLFIAPPNGTGQFFSPSWGPNSDRFYVTRLTGFEWGIHEYTLQGAGESTPVVDEPGVNEVFPAVSPDGRWIAFFSDREGQTRLHLQNLSSGELRKLTDIARTARTIIWAPDSQRLAFVGNSQIYTIAPDGGAAQQLTTVASGYLLHSWSPDSQTLAYRANLVENPFGVDTYEFYAADVSTGEPEQILDLAFDVDILWATP